MSITLFWETPMLLRLDRPVITTLLDEDKYNFHMGNAYHLKFPNAIGRYAYACRDRGVDFSPIYPELKRQIDYLGDLRFTTDECDWLLGNTECSEQYVSYLYNKQILDPRNVDMNLYGDGSMYVSYQGKLDIEAHREVKLLAIISELKFAHQYHGQHDAIDAALNEWVDSEIDWITNHAHPKFAFFEAGGRRRFSKKRQERVLVRLWNNLPKDENGKPKFIMGTSNCMLGKKYNIPTFGTVAHQWYMFFQTVTHPSMSMIRAMDVWREVYNGKLSIALTDTLGNEKWDRDFTKKYQEEHDGQRHDSGSTSFWGRMRLNAYARDNIDPMTKSFTFGDSLDPRSGSKLTADYDGLIGAVNCLMGTFWTNSLGPKFPNHKALSQVAKLMWAQPDKTYPMLPCGKLGADFESAKNQCEDVNHLVYLKTIAQNY